MRYAWAFACGVCIGYIAAILDGILVTTGSYRERA